MKAFSKIVLASVLLVLLLVPSTSMSDRLPAPLVRMVEPGQTTILYADQSLRFTTDVPLKLTLTPLEPGRIHMKVKAVLPRGLDGNAPASGWEIVEIYWLNWGNDIYEGPPPENPWEGILLTESGFTEK